MLLALDTATHQASLALHDGLQVRIEHTWESRRQHTSELLPHLIAALEQIGLTSAEICALAVTRGPGSFTGLRVGLAVAKGLALARGLPLIGVPTLDVVAAAQGKDHRPLCAILQAGRGRICASMYTWERDEWRALQEPRLTTWAALAAETTSPTLFCGEIDAAGIEALTPLEDRAVILPPAACLRRAGFLAEIAWRRLNRGQTDDPAALTPIYLKQPT